MEPQRAVIGDSSAEVSRVGSASYESVIAEIWNSSRRLVVASSSTGLGDERSDSTPGSSPSCVVTAPRACFRDAVKPLPVSLAPEVGDVELRRS